MGLGIRMGTQLPFDDLYQYLVLPATRGSKTNVFCLGLRGSDRTAQGLGQNTRL